MFFREEIDEHFRTDADSGNLLGFINGENVKRFGKIAKSIDGLRSEDFLDGDIVPGRRIHSLIGLGCKIVVQQSCFPNASRSIDNENPFGGECCLDGLESFEIHDSMVCQTINSVKFMVLETIKSVFLRK